jgi:hypothetical protein
VALEARTGQRASQPNAPVVFTLKNTGAAANTDPAIHPADANAFLKSDVYRLSASVEGKGWTVQLLNGLAAVEFGGSRQVTVHASNGAGSSTSAKVTLKAASESDPTKSTTATVVITK